MDTAAWIALGASALLAVHLSVIPLLKKRSIVIRGKEAYAMWALAIVGAGLLQPWLFALLAAQAIVSWLASPWLVVGVRGENVVGAAKRSGAMIRLDVAADGGGRVGLGASSSLRLWSLGTMLKVVTFSPRRSKKVRLFTNVFRKNLQNLAFGVA